jgi:hypothetical protein
MSPGEIRNIFLREINVIFTICNLRASQVESS